MYVHCIVLYTFKPEEMDHQKWSLAHFSRARAERKLPNRKHFITPTVSSHHLFHLTLRFISPSVSSHHLFHLTLRFISPSVSSHHLFHLPICFISPSVSSHHLFHLTICFHPTFCFISLCYARIVCVCVYVCCGCVIVQGYVAGCG